MAARPKFRNPQLSLGLATTTPDPAAQWRDGTTLTYLGRRLSIHLSQTHSDATLDSDNLHLPLPPQAAPQQIRDRAEAWLREQAQSHLSARITALCQQKSLPNAPQLKLAFAARSPWAEAEADDCLRCNWRLIEQPAAIIDQALSHALNSLPAPERELDLFGFAFSARPPSAA